MDNNDYRNTEQELNAQRLNLLPMENGYVSVPPLSAAANFIMSSLEPFTHTYRTYIRACESGKLTLRIWHSNAVDSTWDKGQEASGGEPGGRWRIESAFFGDGGTRRDGRVPDGP
ncbi:hypothetical protein ACFTRD_15085 [Paenibacillus sp. NPDC056933]|uniref:hypothetical protein n=1 Tax=Paenibacillus sp. NPDC056933 TaxID=3345968 RepID=UPI00362A6970